MAAAPDFSKLAAVIRLPEIDSTNDEARRRAEAGERGPLWLIADRQTAGRGRYGRSWQSGEGNFAATYLFAPGLEADRCAQLSFAVALALLDVLDSLPPVRGALKWPNDVLIGGRKVAGILLEAGGAQTGAAPAWLAIGIGVNLVATPQDVPFPATALAEYVPPPAPLEMLARLAPGLNARLANYYAQGFAPLRDAWLARAHGLGGPIHVKLAERSVEGVFEGLSAEGALVLRTGAERREIRAGEVYFECRSSAS